MMRWNGSRAALVLFLVATTGAVGRGQGTNAAGTAGAGTEGAKVRCEIGVASTAPALERQAAAELADQLRKVYRAEVTLREEAPPGNTVILVGSPTTNPLVKQAVGSEWPALSPQGHLVRSVPSQGRTVLVLGGGSPVATWWAVQEFLQQLGIRSLLQGDFVPVQPVPFTTSGWNLVLEPAIPVRGWRTLDAGVLGWEAWSLADHQRVIRQLAKRKFNQLVLSLSLERPYLPVKVDGQALPVGKVFGGEQFPVEGDTAGRKVFVGMTRFENPSIPGEASDADRLAAGVALVKGILAAAKPWGLEGAIRLAPFEGLPATAANPESRIAASVEVVRACVATYPEAACLYLVPPADSSLAAQVTERWKKAVSSGQGPRIVIEGQPGAPRTVPLVADPSSVLPQMSVSQLARLQTGSADRTAGWVLSCGLPTDSELGMYFFSRAAFAPDLAPEQVSTELITTLAGDGVADRLLKGFQAIEKAMTIVQEKSPGFASLGPQMVLSKRQPAEAPPAWWAEIRTLYTDAMNEMYRGNTRAREGGRGFSLYYARRFEFGLTYMTSLEAWRQAAVAKAKDDGEMHTQQLEAAVEGMYNALGAFSEMARDPSDRGLIAALNAYGYRPLMKELEAAE